MVYSYPTVRQLLSVALVSLGALAWLLSSCAPAHQSSITVVSEQSSRAEFHIFRVEYPAIDTVRVGILESEASARYDFTIRHPELIELRSASDSTRCVLLVEPGEHLTVRWSSHSGVEVYGSRQAVRLASLQAYMQAMRDSVRQIATTYPSTNRGGRFDSLRRVANAAYVALLSRGRSHAIRFIDEEPYSKASLVALLAEYDHSAPLFPISGYDSLYDVVLDRIHKVYPPTEYTRLVAAACDTLRRSRQFVPEAYTHLREGDTLSASLVAFLSDCALRCSVQPKGYVVRILNSAHDTLHSRYVGQYAEGSSRLLLCVAVSADGTLNCSYRAVDGQGQAGAIHPIEASYADSVLAWCGAQVAPLALAADSKGRVTSITYTEHALAKE